MNGIMTHNSEMSLLKRKKVVLCKEMSHGQAEHSPDRQLLDEMPDAQFGVLEAAQQELHTHARVGPTGTTIKKWAKQCRASNSDCRGALAEHVSAIHQHTELSQNHADAKHRELQISVERRHRARHVSRLWISC